MDFYNILLPSWFGLSIITAISLRFLRAPYGKYFSTSWGPSVPNKLGWIVMESALLIFLYCFGFADRTWSPAQTVLMIVVVHYLYRSFIFPVMTRTSGKRIPILIVLLAIGHNLGNAYLLGTGLTEHSPWSQASTAPAWTSWHVVAGGLIAAIGFVTHLYADRTLIALRAPGEQGYKIPYGGPYRWVSCPNYMGEIIQWAGFALMTMSPAALAFAVFTASNLGPRAIDTHRWYQSTFKDYPKSRKALIPGVL